MVGHPVASFSLDGNSDRMGSEHEPEEKGSERDRGHGAAFDSPRAEARAAGNYPAKGVTADGEDLRLFVRAAGPMRRFGLSVMREIHSPNGPLAWSTR